MRPVQSVEGVVRSALDDVAVQLSGAGAAEQLIEDLGSLARQVGGTCQIAVAGQVSTGKSTFINALLGEDRAVTGEAETTATINHFVHGTPDPARPVRCHWTNGTVTDESDEFLRMLHGWDEGMLRQAASIQHLEFRLDTPILENITIVDTPGYGTVVAEHHGQTEAYLQLAQGLRSRHDAETAQISETADAVIYLVGAVAQEADRALVERMSNQQGSAGGLTTMGVLAKIDLSPELTRRRGELAAKTEQQLAGSVGRVLPVSAALDRVAQRLDDDPAALDRLLGLLSRSSPATVSLLLQNERLFMNHDGPGLGDDREERAWMRAVTACPWSTFRTLLTTLTEARDGAEALAGVRELGGMGALRAAITEHYLTRASILRCHRILRDAQALLTRYWYGTLQPELRSSRARSAALTAYLAWVGDRAGTDEVAAALADHLTAERSHLSEERLAARQHALVDARRRVSEAVLLLSEHDLDFSALLRLPHVQEVFAPAEIEELRQVLGQYGFGATDRLGGCADLVRTAERQMYWSSRQATFRVGSEQARIAERAYVRLGYVLDEMERQSSAIAGSRNIGG